MNVLRRIVENSGKKPKKEPVIDGYKGFLFLDKKDMPEVALHWENILNGHESIRNNYLRSHLMFADILIAVTWQKRNESQDTSISNGAF